MNITLSTQALLVILIVVLVLALALVSLRTRRRVRPPHEAPNESRRRSPEAAPVAPSEPHAHPVAAEHKNIDMGDHGADVARQYGKQRSPEWPRVAHEHLAVEPACVVCGHTGVGLNVHHIRPFHLFPELELDPTNLITLCQVKGKDHHLLVGHLDNWASYNLNVRPDTKRYADESADQIRSNPSWQAEERARPVG